jgi:fibronectin type 3 domain-containing protein
VGGTFPLTINAGATATLTVQFAPTTATTSTGQLTISSNSTLGSTNTVALSGTGEAPVTHSVDLSWTAPTGGTDPIAGYHIYREASGSTTFTLLNSSLVTQTDYVDSTVVSGASYNYVVKSVDQSGVESVASNQIAITIP